MTIRVGTVGTSPGWEELLRQEGVPFGLITPGGSGALSAVVVCRPPTREETSWLREYLRGGGGVMGSAGFLTGLVELREEPIRLRYLEPGEHPLVGGLSLMDVETSSRLPREANCLRTEENAFGVFAGEMLGGWGVVSPFDPGTALEDFRAAERYFFARQERLPSERVSRVSKGEILKYVHIMLQHLHHARGYPYAHVSHVPAGCRNVSAFRIDTDGGTKEEIDELYTIARENGTGFTWFLDVKSHESWLSRFAEMERQEVGLHCYEHRVFLDPAKDGANIRRGIDTMTASGLKPRAFAAPFGFWSPALGHCIDDAGFAYSSEFSWAYDTLPHRPVTGGVRFRTLQIPVHPVSIGNLRKAGYTPAQMAGYYAEVVDRKLRRREPLIFYHHPGHREWEVVRSLCRNVRSPDIRAMTLGEYGAWWERRGALRACLTFDAGMLEAQSDEGAWDTDFAVRVSRWEGEEAEIGFNRPVAINGIAWHASAAYQPPVDIKRTREFDLRGEIGRQFTRLQRRFL